MRTEKRLSPRLVAAAIGGLLALGAGAPSALAADDFTLNLSGPATAQVGQPMIIQATGTAPPPPDYWFPIWLDVVVVPAGLVSSCPASYLDGDQVAVHTFLAGGEVVTPYAFRVRPDATGGFSHPTGYTPRVAGKMLVCGYIEDGLTYTHVSTALPLNVQPPPAAQQPPRTAQPPRVVSRPRVTRSGKRLACAPGRWSGDPSGYAYGWIVGATRKDGATRPKLRVTRGLRGRKVRCAVTAANAAGATTAVSRALRVR